MSSPKFYEREADLPNIAGMTMREVGARWGVSATRAGQIISALKRFADSRARRTATPHPLTDEWLIDDMALSYRTRSCLRNENILTVGDVRGLTDRQLLSIPNFGRKSMHELRAAIRDGFTPR